MLKKHLENNQRGKQNITYEWEKLYVLCVKSKRVRAREFVYQLACWLFIHAQMHKQICRRDSTGMHKSSQS